MKIIYHCWCEHCQEDFEQKTPMNYCPECGAGSQDIVLYSMQQPRGRLKIERLIVSTERH